MQGFLLLRRAYLSTEARIAIVTLAANSLSFGDVRNACKRYADEFLRDPKEQDSNVQSMCHKQKEQALSQRNTIRKGILAWKLHLQH